MNCILCNKKMETIITSKLRNNEHQDVFYCEDCKLGILSDKRDETDLKNFYKGDYRKVAKPDLTHDTSPEELFNSYVNFQNDRIKIIEPYFHKDKTLLEVGCSAGMFLYHAVDKLKEIVGIDFDVQAAKYAESKCNCKVYTSKITETGLPKKSFDIICAFQILEHVKDPITFLSELNGYLKDDGVMFIEVPNLDDILVSTYNLPFHHQFYFHSAHLFYFSERSLSLLMEKMNMNKEFYFVQDYNMFNHVHWLMNDKPQVSCMPGLSHPQIDLNQISKKT